MKLSKIYSNFPEKFNPIVFNDGLNVVLGKIKQPQDEKKTTHNLGKSILCRLIDFCLLARVTNDFFLLKNDCFENFHFFLELMLDNNNTYITVKRTVKPHTKISLKSHNDRNQNYINLPKDNWDHDEIPIEKAKELLDMYLGWDIPKGNTYRNIIGYFLRSQDDYQDVFHLSKNKGKESDWKPCLASILGFNGELIQSHYDIEKTIEEKKSEQKSLEAIGEKNKQPLNEKVLTLESLKKDVNKKENYLNNFNFYEQDQESIIKLVNSIDEKITKLNTDCYYLNKKKSKIEHSLKKEKLKFDPNKVAQLFEEVDIFFKGQLKKSYEDLIEFNKSITKERSFYLKKNLNGIKQHLEIIQKELQDYNAQKQAKLQFIRNNNALEKYKEYNRDIDTIKKDISDLEFKIKLLKQANDVSRCIKNLENNKNNKEIEISDEIRNQSEDTKGIFYKIQQSFGWIIQNVLEKKAILIVDLNNNSHLIFKAKILNLQGQDTSEDDGHSYKKLICVAFDLAVLKLHLETRFPHFVYHDGVLESLDNRAKKNLLEVFREYTSSGIQSIITINDSDLPDTVDKCFDEKDIILQLTDTGKRLFNIPPW